MSKPSAFRELLRRFGQPENIVIPGFVALGPSDYLYNGLATAISKKAGDLDADISYFSQLDEGLLLADPDLGIVVVYRVPILDTRLTLRFEWVEPDSDFRTATQSVLFDENDVGNFAFIAVYTRPTQDFVKWDGYSYVIQCAIVFEFSDGSNTRVDLFGNPAQWTNYRYGGLGTFSGYWPSSFNVDMVAIFDDFRRVEAPYTVTNGDYTTSFEGGGQITESWDGSETSPPNVTWYGTGESWSVDIFSDDFYGVAFRYERAQDYRRFFSTHYQYTVVGLTEENPPWGAALGMWRYVFVLSRGETVPWAYTRDVRGLRCVTHVGCKFTDRDTSEERWVGKVRYVRQYRGGIIVVDEEGTEYNADPDKPLELYLGPPRARDCRVWFEDRLIEPFEDEAFSRVYDFSFTSWKDNGKLEGLDVGKPRGEAVDYLEDPADEDNLITAVTSGNDVYEAQGEIRLRFESGFENTSWDMIQWVATTPGDSSITCYARVAQTEDGLDSASWVPISNGEVVTTKLPPGKWIELRFVLNASSDRTQTPILDEAAVFFSAPSGETGSVNWTGDELTRGQFTNTEYENGAVTLFKFQEITYYESGEIRIVVDAGAYVHWTGYSFSRVVPEGTSLDLYYRLGMSRDELRQADWTELGEVLDARSRFIEIRMVLTASDDLHEAPACGELVLYYCREVEPSEGVLYSISLDLSELSAIFATYNRWQTGVPATVQLFVGVDDGNPPSLDRMLEITAREVKDVLPEELLTGDKIRVAVRLLNYDPDNIATLDEICFVFASDTGRLLYIM